MKKSLNNFYFRMLVRVLKDNKVYNHKEIKPFLDKVLFFIKTKDGNEPPHLFFNYGRCDIFYIRDIYVNYIIDKYVSDICKGLEYHLDKKLTKLDTLYLKANIKECKLYWAVKRKYDVGESILNDIISKYCYENDSEKFICKSFKRN